MPSCGFYGSREMFKTRVWFNASLERYSMAILLKESDEPVAVIDLATYRLRLLRILFQCRQSPSDVNGCFRCRNIEFFSGYKSVGLLSHFQIADHCTIADNFNTRADTTVYICFYRRSSSVNLFLENWVKKAARICRKSSLAQQIRPLE